VPPRMAAQRIDARPPPGGQTAAIGKTAESETKIPRRPAQLTQADVARVIRAAKQAGASEAYTNNWNAVPLV
jgi:hypothetical protein